MNALQQVREGRIRALNEGTVTPKAFRAQAGDDGPAEMWFYDMIDDWFGIASADIVRALLDFDGADLLVHVNSPGGMVTEGLAIYNTFRNYAGTVTMRVEGMAASAASFVILAGDVVEVEPTAMVMIHDAWDITIGDADEHARALDLLNKASDNIAGIYAGKAGGTVVEWRDRMKATTWYVGSEAVDAGLIDRVNDPATAPETASAAASSAPRATWSPTLFGHTPTARVATPTARHQSTTPTFDLSVLRDGLKGVLAS